MARGLLTAGAGLTDKINRLKDFIREEVSIYGSPDAGLGSTASMLGMSQADLNKHFDEWFDYAIKPEISSSEYHRRGGELLSADSREGWHSKVPLGQFVLPALALGYQLPQEIARGWKQNVGFSPGSGKYSALLGLGKGLYTGVKDAAHNIQGMARAGQFDERFYQESGEDYKKGLGADFVPHQQTSGTHSRPLSVEDILGEEPIKPDVTENINKVTPPVKPYTPAKQFSFEDVKSRAARLPESTPAAGAKDISFLLQNTPSATPVRRRRGGRPARRGFIPPTRNYGGGHHGR